jgi:hypothetical protein
MKTPKKLHSFRLSENFIAAVDELANHFQREEGPFFPWAKKWDRTRTIQRAVRKALEEFSPEGVAIKKKPAKKKAKARN